MRLRRYLSFGYIRETFLTLFWEFHWILLFGMLTMLLALPIVSAGPALLALCAMMRHLARGEGVKLRDYFAQFRRLLKPGLFFSLLLALGTASVWASLRELSNGATGAVLASCVVALILVMAGCFFLFLFPFVAYDRKTIAEAAAHSAIYAANNMLDVLSAISLCVILFFAARALRMIGLLVFLPLCCYWVARMVHAHNLDVEERMKAEGSKVQGIQAQERLKTEKDDKPSR